MVLAAGFALAGCTTVSDYCSENPLMCVLAAKAVVGGVVLVVANSEDPVPESDIRLKHDIDYLMTLDNGLKLYSFAYLGDEQTFVGVMAQDLLADPRYASAVSIDAQGFYRVDYNALGLGLYNAEAMMQAGAAAEALAGS